MQSNNNNKDNIFVNLPIFLIENIVNRITKNIDKICFTFVCKRFFDLREKYMLFDSNTISLKSEHLYLNSFKSIYENSLKSKDNCIHYVDMANNFIFDYNVNDFDNEVPIKPDVSTLILGHHDEIPRIYKVLKDSNVTTFKYCKTLQYPLPPTLKKLKFGYFFNEDVDRESFPDGIEDIKFEVSFTKSIKPSTLPVSLKKLSFGKGYRAPLVPRSLPPKLEILKYVSSPITTNILPHTLRVLKFVPISWISVIKELPNLEVLHFNDSENQDIVQVDLSEIPKSVTDLAFLSDYTLTSALPLTIKSFTTYTSLFNNEELFPPTVNYQLDSMELWMMKISLPSNVKVKKMTIVTYSLKLVAGQISEANGIESLDISRCKSFYSYDGFLLANVKELKINVRSIEREITLPETLETMILVNSNRSNANKFVIPRSVKTVVIESDSSDLSLDMIPPTVNQIFITKNYHHSEHCEIRKLDNDHYLVFEKMMQSNNNNNKDNIFVNLPILLIGNIVNRITENIDKICFTFVCKRFFDCREKYLLFDPNTIILRYEYLYLNSFKSIYRDSLKSKDNCIFYLDITDTNFDYSLTDFEKDKSINPNVSTVTLLCSEANSIHRSIHNSNVKNFRYCDTLRYPLPPTLKKLTFGYYFNEDLQRAALFEGIEKIKFGTTFAKSIVPGVLPLSLKKLTFGPIYSGTVLPGSLPPNLESLKFPSAPITANVLPQSIRALKYVPVSWMPFIKDLPNLEVLHFNDSEPENGENQHRVDLSELPKSVTDLAFFSEYHLTSALPTTIKKLAFQVKSTFGYEEMFPANVQYHLDSMEVCTSVFELPSNVRVKRMEIVTFSLKLVAGQISDANGIESLDVSACSRYYFDEGFLPASVKELKINAIGLVRVGALPETLESMTLTHNVKPGPNKQQLVIPRSVKTVVINFNSRNLNFDNIPPTVNHIFARNLYYGSDCEIRKFDDDHYLVFDNNEYNDDYLYMDEDEFDENE
ncbi:hypothetical protein PPL_06280 [Heterostelium album PN500]|uniref:FNIP repeat-containing protein n=1 Tax=Heterostelium pallidum (strain ATCC 26659 / Pp 5 / PN500) TaxID=670386 RepID=D3BCQ4_HETP5|nr:hypothetical protein PPL_06280 [Heterostelium album PN500]EFA80696.1 hypothetical protein PPL_06280 [Heterostelium album PN500]|eukprot:XP_020432816.1 hypothetical protein PPL_06280 [Heterostelium album PN500]